MEEYVGGGGVGIYGGWMVTDKRKTNNPVTTLVVRRVVFVKRKRGSE